jgi:REP element-mobilizing transposase RayT
MPRNVYSEINLHITWHTKGNCAVLADSVEHQLHRFLRNRIAKTRGAFLHAIGGTTDHIHLAVTVPPTIPIADWIGELKGSSTYHINHEICNRKVLNWQTGYGIVSFGSKDLPWIIAYIRNQKEHHAKGTTHDRLERTEIENPVKTGSMK